MNELHRAYIVLGLEPGCSLESIMRRYKRLIMVWHPDRAPTGEHREFAEQELKKINSAKETLTRHFGSGGNHKDGRCECQPSVDERRTNRELSKGAPGPGYHRRGGKGQVNNSEVMAAPVAASQQGAKRWMTGGMILVVGAIALFAVNSWRNAGIPSSEQMSINQSVVPGRFALPGSSRTATAIAPLAMTRNTQVNRSAAPPPVPAQTTMSRYPQASRRTIRTAPAPAQRTMAQYPQASSNAPLAPGQRPMPVYPQTNSVNAPISPAPRMVRPPMNQETRVQMLTMLEVEKCQKQLERCNVELTRIESRLGDATITDQERRKLVKMQLFQQKNLRIAQANLDAAKEKLSLAGGGSSPPAETRAPADANNPWMFQ